MNMSDAPPAIDFAALHREKLQRDASRKRQRNVDISPPPISRKAPKLEETTVTLPSGARLTSFQSIVEDQQKERKTAVATAASSHLRTRPSSIITTNATASQMSSTTPGSLHYPHGVVKKTWAYGHARAGDDIKLEEVLEAQSLRTAVLSAFQWDPDWIFSKLKIPPNGGSTKCVFVMQAKEQAQRDEIEKQNENVKSFLRFCFPPMLGLTHCMHSKLMLLFHPDKLRITVPTANLLNFDWGETGLMENSVWLIDLPRLPNGVKIAAKDLTDFGKELLYFMRKSDFPQDVLDGILNFDFAATAPIAFVHTVGGVTYNADAERTGLPGLARSVQALNLSSSDAQIDFAASSIGSLNDEFLSNVHAAVSGQDMIQRSSNAITASKASFFTAKKPSPKDHSIRDHIRIYFPTKETVQDSTAGAAGTICLNRKWFESMTFPRRCFRDYISTRPGMLSHNKILYARGSQPVGEGSIKQVAWAYVGSSNMSESAWGKLVYDKKSKQWKLNCRNWECGVLLPVSGERVAAQGSEGVIVDIDVFDDVVKPPFMIPGVEYEGREPWYFLEKHAERGEAADEA